MRLGQIARKLGVSQTEIVRYLSGQNMGIEEGSNVKLEEQHVRQLYAHFAPGESFETKSPNEEPTATSVPAALVVPAAELPRVQEPTPVDESAPALPGVVLEGEPIRPEALSEAAIDPPSTMQSNPELAETIRAPKIELAGLKVVGKIELPEPKKKETFPSDDSTEVPAIVGTSVAGGTIVDQEQKSEPIQKEAAGEERSREKFRREDGRGQDERRRARNNQSREQRPRKNPIAAQRERELEAERERRKEKAAEDKERRTQNYHKRVKHSPPTKAVRLIEEPVEQLNEGTMQQEPKTWFGKLVKWLRG